MHAAEEWDVALDCCHAGRNVSICYEGKAGVQSELLVVWDLRHADAAGNDISGGLVAGGPIIHIHESHADDTNNLLVECGDVEGLHTTGAQAVQRDRSTVFLKLVVDQVATNLDPVFVGMRDGFVDDGAAIAWHVRHNQLESSLV